MAGAFGRGSLTGEDVFSTRGDSGSVVSGVTVSQTRGTGKGHGMEVVFWQVMVSIVQLMVGLY